MVSFRARIILSVLSIWAAIRVCPAGDAGELARPVPADAQVTRFTRFNIRYTLRDIVAEGVRKVDFYITNDMGGTWREYGQDADKISPMTVEVDGEGVYGFVCVVTDRHGNREREPGPRTRPETVIVVDRTPPTAKWLAPTQDILGRGQSVEFSWESADDYFADNPVTLQYAANAQGNHDRNANWQTMREDLPATGTHTWTPLSSSAYNFRLVAEDRAGNAAVAYLGATVRVDNTPPYITGIQPLRSNKLENDIIVEAGDNDGGAGVKEYSLYISDNGAATWTLVKENAGGESLPVKRPSGGAITWTAPRPGEYPLWPVVFDEAGNATPLPAVAVAGPYIMTIDNEPPQVTLSSSFLMGRAAVLANETRRVEWTSYDPHTQEGSAAILLSLDNGNTWRELRNGLPANGFETINFPFGEQSEEAKLKVTVMDTFGNAGESVSETFKLSEAETTIDSVTPRSDSSASSASGGDPFGLGGTGFGSGDGSLPSSAPAPLPADGSSGFGGMGGQQQLPSGVLPGASGFDPYGGGGDAFGGGADMYRPLGGAGYGSGESTAGSLPQAMLGGNANAGSLFGDAPGAPSGISSGYAPPPPGGAQQLDIGGLTGYADSSAPAAPLSADAGWQPSPGAAPAGDLFGAGSVPAPAADSGSGMSAWDALQASSGVPASSPVGMGGANAGLDGWASSGAGSTIAAAPAGSDPFATSSTPDASLFTAPAGASPFSASAPVTTPATSSSPAIPSTPDAMSGDLALGDSSFPAFGDGTDPFAPPPAVQTGNAGASGAPSLPAFDSTGFGDAGFGDDAAGGLSLDGFGGGVTDGPGLPPASAQTTPSAPSTNAAQAGSSSSGDSGLPWPATTSAMPPVARNQPPAMPGLEGAPLAAAGSGLSLPQPLAAQQNRPVDQRQASLRHVAESKSFRDEGRPDLALESARKAVESDPANAAAYMELSQVNARMTPPDHVAAANLAKEATNLQADWETWWNCADVFYIWANASNREIQSMLRQGQTPPITLVDERNSTLSNASIAVNNAASVLPRDNREAAKKVLVTQGMIAYQRALSVPEPYSGGATEGPALDDFRRRQAEYKSAVTPLLQEAMPFFRNALSMDGPPEYNETFQLGIINFRLAGLERDTGNAAQATTHYQDAVTYLEQATTAANAPKEGPREAYYMLALCHDQLSAQPSANRARHRELALRYWRQTADFYAGDSAYGIYAVQRIDALSEEMGL